MKRKYFWLNILLILAVTSCREEPLKEEPADKELVPQYLVIEPEMVTDSVGKQVYIFGFYTLVGEDVDIDKDLAGDLQFTCWENDFLPYDEWGASVRTLSDSVEIDARPYKEYIARYYLKHAYSNGTDSMTLHYKENYSPDKAYPSNLKIDTLTTLYPVIHSAGDTLSAQGSWNMGDFLLKYDDHSSVVMANIERGIWRDVSKKMIGIRFREGGKIRYGWIEISVSGYSIRLHRFACME